MDADDAFRVVRTSQNEIGRQPALSYSNVWYTSSRRSRHGYRHLQSSESWRWPCQNEIGRCRVLGHPHSGDKRRRRSIDPRGSSISPSKCLSSEMLGDHCLWVEVITDWWIATKRGQHLIIERHAQKTRVQSQGWVQRIIKGFGCWWMISEATEAVVQSQVVALTKANTLEGKVSVHLLERQRIAFWVVKLSKFLL